MALTAVSIVNVALPSIQEGLGATSTDLQWVLSGYSLTFGVILVAAGRAGDLLGRDRLFVAGVAIFGLASMVATMAPTPLILNIARAFMGIGSGIYNPQISGLIQQHYQGAERARAFGMFGAVVGSAVAIGPLMGGALIGWGGPEVGWRWTIGINIPLSFITIILAILWLPHTPKRFRSSEQDLDPVGAVLLGLAVLATMSPFMMASDHPATWWLLPLGLLLGGAWLVWERAYKKRGRAPMVDLNLFKVRSYSFGVIMISVFFAGSTTIWVLIAQFLQGGMGESALVTGMIGFPAALLSIFSAYIGGKLVMRLGRWLVVIGLVITLVGIVGTAWITTVVSNGDLSVWAMSLTAVPLGFGASWITSPNQTLTLREVPVTQGGTAAGIMQTGQRISTAMGTAAVTGLFFHHIGDGYAKALDYSYFLIGVFTVIALIIAIIDAIVDKEGMSASA